MKTPKLLLAVALLALAVVSTLPAATVVWSGADGANINTAGNWTPAALPTIGDGNVGEINTGSGGVNMNVSLTNYQITQNSRTVSGAASRTLTGGYWTLNGGTLSVAGQINLSTGHTLTVNGGLLTNSGANNVTVGSAGTGSLLDVTAGTVTFASSLNVNAGNSYTQSGGSVTAATNLGITGSVAISGGSFAATAGTIGGAGSLTLTGGTVSAGTNIQTTTGWSLTLGGTSAGSLTAAGWAGTAAARNTNFLSGTKISMTLTGVSGWAQTEWDADRLYFNGSNKTALSGLTWTSATSTGGLGSGYNFAFNSGTNTLTLVPEPSSWLLLGACLTTVMIFRRRRAVQS